MVQLEASLKLATAVNYSQLSTVPDTSGIYTGWLDGEKQCLYVGKSNSIWKRIQSHYSGQRGNNQFCLYIYDQYVFGTRAQGLLTADVNQLTATWIRERVSFRFVAAPKEELTTLESALRRSWQPILNPLPPG